MQYFHGAIVQGKTKASGAAGGKRLLPRAVPLSDSRLAAAEKEVVARLQSGFAAQPAPLEVHLEDSFEFPELPRKGNASNISRWNVAAPPKHAPLEDLPSVPQVELESLAVKFSAAFTLLLFPVNRA